MNHTLTLLTFLYLSTWSVAQESKVHGPAGRESTGTYEVITAKVEAVFKMVDESGFEFIAYQINFKGNPVIVEDPTCRSNAKVGDDLRVVVCRTDLSKSAKNGKRVISFVVGAGKA